MHISKKRLKFHYKKFPTNEKPQMAQDAEDLIAQLTKRFPERDFYALVADLKGF